MANTAVPALTGYVTRGLISWLDGYYYSNEISNKSESYDFVLKSKDFSSSSSALRGDIDLDNSCYMFTNIYDNDFSDFTSCSSYSKLSSITGKTETFNVLNSSDEIVATVVSDSTFFIGGENYTLDTNYVNGELVVELNHFSEYVIVEVDAKKSSVNIPLIISLVILIPLALVYIYVIVDYVKVVASRKRDGRD